LVEEFSWGNSMVLSWCEHEFQYPVNDDQKMWEIQVTSEPSGLSVSNYQSTTTNEGKVVRNGDLLDLGIDQPPRCPERDLKVYVARAREKSGGFTAQMVATFFWCIFSSKSRPWSASPATVSSCTVCLILQSPVRHARRARHDGEWPKDAVSACPRVQSPWHPRIYAKQTC
jgi:hypothetical protein